MVLLRSPLLWKIYAIFVAIILLSSIIVGSVVGRLIEKRTLNEVRRTLEVRTLLLSRLSLPYIKEKVDPILQSTIKNLGHNTGTRLTLIGVNGLVLADSDRSPVTMDNHGQRPEILDSLHYEYGVATRFSETLQTRMMYLARSIRKGPNIFGYARASLPLTLIQQRIKRPGQRFFSILHTDYDGNFLSHFSHQKEQL